MKYVVIIAAVLLCLYFLLKKMGKLHPWMKKVIFAYLAIFLCLAVLEIAMIISEPYLSNGFYQYDPDLGFRVRPYSSGTNMFGFNDQDYALDKPDGIFRILVVGDSFNWAGGKEGNYTTVLERKFESYYGAHRIDVVNAGYPMTHTGEQFAMLKKYGLQYQPDMVFIGFFAGNDFIDADPHRKRIVVNDTYFDIDRRFEVKILGYPIVFKSRLWHFLKQRFIVWKNLDEVHAWDSTQLQQEDSHDSHDSNDSNDSNDNNDDAGTFTEKAYLEIERYRLGFCHMPSHKKGVYKENIDFILQTFTQMNGFLDARNIKLAVGIYPDEFQVNENLLSHVFRTFDLERDQFDIELIQRLLEEHFISENINYIDLLDSFKREGVEKQLYLNRNTHWNPAGNELAAEVLFRFLTPQIDATLTTGKTK